jgi:hypothetical protein
LLQKEKDVIWPDFLLPLLGSYQHRYEMIWRILNASLSKVKGTSVGQIRFTGCGKMYYGLRVSLVFPIVGLPVQLLRHHSFYWINDNLLTPRDGIDVMHSLVGLCLSIHVFK